MGGVARLRKLSTPAPDALRPIERRSFGRSESDDSELIGTEDMSLQ